MDDRKCECGHTNPIGTVLCESCGKPLEIAYDEKGHMQFPDMRYEGMARRSQTYSKTVIDKVWNFFSSVKIAVILIIITLIASAIGTIYPQERYIPAPVPTEESVAQFYETTYGKLGAIYYQLGFHNLFTSWWFVTLLVMIGTSLVICSLDRVVPLYKALNKPRVKQHISFLQGQKIRGNTDALSAGSLDEKLNTVEEALRKKGYRVYREETSVLGEKGRFSRWGPYINHCGLIIFLLAVLLRGLPGLYLDKFVWVREGQTVAIPNTPYYVKNVEYKTEYYDESEFPEKVDLNGGVVPKNFQTDAILYLNKNASIPGEQPDLVEVKRGPIQVNHPMIYEDLSLFQAANREQELGAFNFVLIDMKAGNKPVGPIKLDLFSPAAEQKVTDDIMIRVLGYFPDFVLEGDQPATKSSTPNNPMFALEIENKTLGTKERLVYLSRTVISKEADPRYTLQIKMPDLIDTTGLMVRKDKMLPLIYTGLTVFLVGVVMGIYWQHRRIWVHVENSQVYVAAHTNKNWFGLRREVDYVIEKASLPITITQEQKAKNASTQGN